MANRLFSVTQEPRFSLAIVLEVTWKYSKDTFEFSSHLQLKREVILGCLMKKIIARNVTRLLKKRVSEKIMAISGQ